MTLHEVIHRRDKLLKAILQAQLLNQDIPYEQLRDALEKGFKEVDERWRADLRKYDQETARILEGQI
jgi:hypothetical protein